MVKTALEILLFDRQAAIDVVAAWLHKALNPLNRSKYNEGEIDAYETALSELKKIPSAQPERNNREFIKLAVRDSNGRPYYSIIYLEFDKNGIGHDFEGYSSYSLDVISDYLKKYFIPSAQLERKRGKWISTDDGWDGEYFVCSECGCPWTLIQGSPEDNGMNFCPNCGTDMREMDDE